MHSIFAYKITNSHPRLAWLAGQTANGRTIQGKILDELSRLTEVKKAASFVKSSGLAVATSRESDHASAIYVLPPENVNFESAKESAYHSPQIILPKIGCPVTPFGTMIMNCLLPENENILGAESDFAQYQEIVLKLCGRVNAFPFACLTGFKLDSPRNDLSLRGFRFFFSPQPDQMFLLMVKILNIYETFSSKESGPEEKRLQYKLLDNYKFIIDEERPIRNMVIEEIKPMSSGTELVDLRNQ
jgi:hypothetical protein